MAKKKPTLAEPTSETQAIARLHVWQVQAVRDVLFIAAIVALFWAGYALRAVTVPLLVALLFAYLFEPLIDYVCRTRKLNRPVVVGGLLGAACLAVLVIGAIVVPLAVVQSVDLFNDFRGGKMQSRIALLERWVPASMSDQFRNLLETIPGVQFPPPPAEGGPDDPTSPATPEGDARPADADDPGSSALPDSDADVRAMVERVLADRAARDGRGAAGAAATGPSDWGTIVERVMGSARAAADVLGATVRFGLLCFLIPFYFFFFSVSYPAVVRFGRDLIPEKKKKRTTELLAKMDRVIAGFVRGRIVISLIMGAMLAVGWMLCGVPYAIVLGMIVGIFCAVPYLGVIGVPLAVGLLFIDRFDHPGDDSLWWVWVLLWPTVVFVIVQLIEGYVLTPMIAGKATNLDPVTILVAVLAGGSVLGVYGMLLAIPLAACAKILFVDVLLPDIRAWTRGETEDPLPIDRE